MKYEHIINLMSLWQEFEEHEQSQDMKRFSVWLSRRTSSAVQLQERMKSVLEVEQKQVLNNLADALRTKVENQYREAMPVLASKEEREEVMHYYRHLPLNSRISALLTRMNRFASFYTKKAFAGLEITSAQEFGILACIQGLGTPTKTEVAHYNLLEKTTGTEILKRLLKLGFIEEFDDENDKRSKRVKITQSGNDVMESAVQRLWELSEIVVGNLSEPQKHDLATMLEELDHFHSNIYFNESALQLDEIITKNVLKMA
ncbi:MAG: winged helix DNA-binding protein [Candidatus Kapabacteria bacterium]|jgi:DNA-binding MarR family transcriptional regulator|nr:winged helix DNA-binding protein [Candidatus Kapabacteria bacterium]